MLKISQKLNGNVNKKNTDCFIKVKSLELQSDLEHLDDKKGFKIKEIIRTFNNVFAKNKFNIGRVCDHELVIKLTERRYV